MWPRFLIAVVAALLAVNGLHMLFAPEHWYGSLESVVHTGPFNPHFIQDVGIAYLAATLGLAIGVWRPNWLLPAALTALTFLGLHSALHVWESVIGTESAHHGTAIDVIGIHGPTLLVFICIIFSQRRFPRREEV